ncbi:phosphatase PAP2 family protein [Virgibacillus sp. MSP4-1]|nr:phosphatase PAP2 family protein [Virgibacillus sp. MSP4-1]
MADNVLEKEKFMIDRMAREFVQSAESPAADRVFSLITELGSVMFITICSVLVAAGLWIFYQRRKWRILYFAVAMIGISVLTTVLKGLYERKRPSILAEYDGTGFSFPSGHSTGSMVFYGFLIYLTIRSGLHAYVKWLIYLLLVIIILAIGFSRIYLNVHYATDVIAGYLIGLIWLVSCVLVLEYTLWRKRRK